MHSHSGLGKKWRRFKRKQGLNFILALAVVGTLALVSFLMFLLSWRF